MSDFSPLTQDYPGVLRAATQARLPSWLETIVDQRQVPEQQVGLSTLEGMFQNTSAIQWNIDLEAQVPNWLADDDFDLNALNSSVMASAVNDVPTLACQAEESPLLAFLAQPTSVHEPREEDLLCHQWFSFIPARDTGRNTPNTVPEQTEVDDQYREGLSNCLQQRVMAEPLPSTEFLVRLGAWYSSSGQRSNLKCRINACKCISPASALYSQSFILPHFGLLLNILYYFYQSARSEVSL